MANRLGIDDHSLDSPAADRATSLATLHRVSVADAYVGVAFQASGDGRVVVLTNDPGDIEKVAGDRHVKVVRI